MSTYEPWNSSAAPLHSTVAEKTRRRGSFFKIIEHFTAIELLKAHSYETTKQAGYFSDRGLDFNKRSDESIDSHEY